MLSLLNKHIKCFSRGPFRKNQHLYPEWCMLELSAEHTLKTPTSLHFASDQYTKRQEEKKNVLQPCNFFLHQNPLTTFTHLFWFSTSIVEVNLNNNIKSLFVCQGEYHQPDLQCKMIPSSFTWFHGGLIVCLTDSITYVL